ncbi:MAG TPA: M14 family metallopeptidase [Pseudonocardiaceae bacterium]
MHTPTRADKARLQGLGLDLTEHGDADSVEVVLYGDADVRRLREAGFAYDVRIADLAARDAANRRADERYAAATLVSPLPSGHDSYRRLPDYERELGELASAYPALARVITLNYPSWEGRLVRGLEIAKDVTAQDGKPIFLMMGAHHAREWPSAEHTMEFAYDLLRNYGTDARTTRLVDATRTILVPVANPDGFNVSREARTGPATQDFSIHDFEMKRKNCRDAVGKCDQQTRLSGVDTNRNYGGLWGGSGASPNPLSDVYRGPGPFSEPEVQNIRELVGSHQVVTMITNHTYSNLILRPPGVLDYGFPLEEPQLAALGARMASRNGYANIPGFGLYDTTGTTEDWTFWSAGGIGYTFEIGPSEFHPPFETGVVAEYLGLAPAAGAGMGGNRAAYYDMLEATADTTLHSVLIGSAPAGASLSLRKTFQTLTSPVCQNSFCTVVGPPLVFPDTLTSEMVTSGRTFAWHVNPSTRPATAGRYGREAVAPVQSNVAMFNDPAVVPEENVYYPSPAPRLTVPYETFQFTVNGPPAADNGRFTVHIDWTDPANDWDVYVLDSTGAIVTQSAAFGDATEDASLVDPPAGTYTAVIVNYDQVSRQFDDWRGEVRFASPTPTTIGPKEAWTFECRTGDTVTSREVIVDRGQTLDLGNACKPAK